MRRAAALLALAGFAGAGGLALSAVGPSRRFQSADLRCAFTLPRGWEPAPQIGYPRVLVLANAPDGARLDLVVQPVGAGTSAITLAADARAALVKLGFGDLRVSPEADERVTHDAARLEGRGAGGRTLLRQEYLVDGNLAWVLTVATPASRPARVGSEFLDALLALEITPTATGDRSGLEQPASAGLPDAGAP